MTDANDNEIRVIWSDIQSEYLIDQRISRNRYFFYTLHKIISFVIIKMDFSRNFQGVLGVTFKKTNMFLAKCGK